MDNRERNRETSREDAHQAEQVKGRPNQGEFSPGELGRQGLDQEDLKPAKVTGEQNNRDKDKRDKNDSRKDVA